MDPVQKLLIAKAIEERLLDYWHEVDENGGRRPARSGPRTPVWEAPARNFKGRAEIQSFFDWRLTRGDRLAFHMVANLKTVVESETRASSTWYLVLYAADGKPIQPSGAPARSPRSTTAGHAPATDRGCAGTAGSRCCSTAARRSPGRRRKAEPHAASSPPARSRELITAASATSS